jgi:hypothetical protein
MSDIKPAKPSHNVYKFYAPRAVDAAPDARSACVSIYFYGTSLRIGVSAPDPTGPTADKWSSTILPRVALEHLMNALFDLDKLSLPILIRIQGWGELTEDGTAQSTTPEFMSIEVRTNERGIGVIRFVVVDGPAFDYVLDVTRLRVSVGGVEQTPSELSMKRANTLSVDMRTRYAHTLQRAYTYNSVRGAVQDIHASLSGDDLPF